MNKNYVWTAHRSYRCCALCFLSGPEERSCGSSSLPSSRLFPPQGVWGLAGCPQKCGTSLRGQSWVSESHSLRWQCVSCSQRGHSCTVVPGSRFWQVALAPWVFASLTQPCGVVGSTLLGDARWWPPSPWCTASPASPCAPMPWTLWATALSRRELFPQVKGWPFLGNYVDALYQALGRQFEMKVGSFYIWLSNSRWKDDFFKKLFIWK